jgi:hypothetical protein
MTLETMPRFAAVSCEDVYTARDAQARNQTPTRETRL